MATETANYGRKLPYRFSSIIVYARQNYKEDSRKRYNKHNYRQSNYKKACAQNIYLYRQNIISTYGDTIPFSHQIYSMSAVTDDVDNEVNFLVG